MTPAPIALQPAPMAVGAWRLRLQGDASIRPEPGPVRDGPVRALEIIGIEPRSLARVCLESDGVPIFELESVANGRGGWICAGELLLDMARQFGLGGLVVDLAAQRPMLRGLVVDLVVHAASDPSAGIELIASF